ncbi:MAG: MFS transporter [Actinomycetota bacterium]|nr:MAG: MFS transporter [Actinomycetota bacterium]
MKGLTDPSVRLVLLVVVLSALGYSLLQSLVMPVLPTLQAELGTTTTGVSWLMTAYLLAAAVATPVLGKLGDIHGKKGYLLVSLGALCAGSVVAALAPNLTIMIIGRGIQGLGGAVFPLCYGIMRDEFPPQRVAGSIGIVSALLGVGSGVGLLVAGPVVSTLGYHWLFWLPALVIAVVIVIAARVVPTGPRHGYGRVSWASAVLLSAWLVTLLLGISQGPTLGWTSPATVSLFAATAVFFLGWIRTELRSAHPLVSITMMRLPIVARTNLTALVFGAGMMAPNILLLQYVQLPVSSGGYGAGILGAGLFILPSAVGMLIAGALAGPLASRFGSRNLLVTAGILSVVGELLVLVWLREPAALSLSSAIVGAGTGLAFGSLSNLVIAAVPRDQTSVAAGMNTNIRVIGSAVGTSVIAAILTAGTVGAAGLPPVSAFVVGAAVITLLFVAATVAAATIPDPRRHVTTNHAIDTVREPSMAGS